MTTLHEMHKMNT